MEPLEKYGLERCNGIYTSISPGLDIAPRQEHERILSKAGHSEYRIRTDEQPRYMHKARHLLHCMCTCTERPRSDRSTCQSRHTRLRLPSCNCKHRYKIQTRMRASDQSFLGLRLGRLQQSRRSTSVTIITSNDSPVLWNSNRRSTVALFSAEADYVALSTTAKEVPWICMF